MDSVIARVWKESCIYGRAYFYVYSHDSEIYVTDTLPLDTFVVEIIQKLRVQMSQ